MMNELPNQEPIAASSVGAATVGARALGDGSSREETDLKPCPFCGHVGLDFDEGSTFRWLAYSCGGCGMGSETRVQTLGDGDPAEWRVAAERNAVTEWNRRAALAAPAAPEVPNGKDSGNLPDDEEIDALRYRFLRAGCSIGEWPPTALPSAPWAIRCELKHGIHTNAHIAGEELDAAIDLARAVLAAGRRGEEAKEIG